MMRFAKFLLNSSLGITPAASKLLFYASQTVLSLAFFKDSTKEIGTNCVFLRQSDTI